MSTRKKEYIIEWDEEQQRHYVNGQPVLALAICCYLPNHQLMGGGSGEAAYSALVALKIMGDAFQNLYTPTPLSDDELLAAVDVKGSA